MGALLGPASLLLLEALGLALLPLGIEGPLTTSKAAEGSSLHSLHYFFTFLSEPGEGFPQFIALGYIDNQLFYQYDSNSRKVQPRVSWMEKVDAQYWDTQTKMMQGKESEFRGHMGTLSNYYNHSEGLHTLQKMFGCELWKDGRKGKFARYAYDGRNHVSFNLGTWTAADVPAQITKIWLEGETNEDQSLKAYLEEECIEWLQKFLNVGKESLLRTEAPVGKVTHQAIGDGQEALICQVYGFYPKEIDATWRKGEEILEHETFRRSIAPNFDGTYHSWLSIETDPKERDLYRCHVDHASLAEPMVLAFKEPGDSMGLTVGSIVGVIAVGLMICITFLFLKNKTLRRRKAYKEAPTGDQNSASSTSSARNLLPAASEPPMTLDPSAVGTEIDHPT